MPGLFPHHRAPLSLAAASAAIALAVLPSGAAGAADDELIVGFRSDTPSLQSRAAHGSGGVVTRRLPVQGLAVVEPRGGRSRASLAAELADDHRVRFVEPNGVVRRLLTPDDPEFGAQWGLKNIGQTVDGVTGMAGADVGATSAWDTTRGAPGVRVAVLDGGVDRTVPDIAPNAPAIMNAGESGAGRESNGVDDDGNGFVDDVAGWDWVGDDNDPHDLDFVSHGTHVASVIAARGNDGQGVAGVAWDASIMPLRVLNAFGFGSVADVVEGLAYAGEQGARVVNVSLGGEVSGQTMQAAIDAYPNTLFVVAAGNAADDNDGPSPTMPCAVPSPNVICVAATDQSDDLAGFSNVGATTVDLAAPGVNVLGARRGGGTQFLDGTSFSAPHVAGVAALVIAGNPSASSAQVKTAIMHGATPIAGLAGTTVTGARLSAPGALASVPAPGAAPTIIGSTVESPDSTSAVVRAGVHPAGSTTTYHVEWGADPRYGHQSAVRGLADAGTPTDVAEAITGLRPGSTYHARIVATDVDGVAVGPDLMFTTPGGTSDPGGPGDPPSTPSDTTGGAPASPADATTSPVVEGPASPSAPGSEEPSSAAPTAVSPGPSGVRVGFRRRGTLWRAIVDLPSDAVVSARLQRRVFRAPTARRGFKSRLSSVRGFRRRGYRSGRHRLVLGRLKPGTHRLALRVRAGGSERAVFRSFRVAGPRRPRGEDRRARRRSRAGGRPRGPRARLGPHRDRRRSTHLRAGQPPPAAGRARPGTAAAPRPADAAAPGRLGAAPGDARDAAHSRALSGGRRARRPSVWHHPAGMRRVTT